MLVQNSLRFYPSPHDPFRPHSSNQPLPALMDPAAALLSLNGSQYIFLFGGADDSSCLSSKLIAVDLDAMAWWFIDVQGVPAVPRMACSMVGVNNALYIFNGRRDFEDTHVASYSVAQYNPENGLWSWIATDVPYPQHVPALGHGGRAISVYGGKKILLAAGRARNASVSFYSNLTTGCSTYTSVQPIKLTEETTVFFHTENHTFTVATETVGDFPEDVKWYDMNVFPTFQSSFQIPVSSPTTTPRRRGRPRKLASRAPASDPPSVSSVSSVPPCAVIVGWINADDSEELVPEAWQYFLPPEERIRCLGLRELIGSLEVDLQACSIVRSRMFLLGYETPLDAEGDDTYENAVWNACVEVPVEILVRN